MRFSRPRSNFHHAEWLPPLATSLSRKKIVLDVNGRQMSAEAFAQELAFRLKDHDALSAKDPTNALHHQEQNCRRLYRANAQ